MNKETENGERRLGSKGNKTYSEISENGFQSYTEDISKRRELTERILQGIREGNEYQTLRAVQEKNRMDVPGRLNDELTEWKYELIQMMALIIIELCQTGTIDLILDALHTEYTRLIYKAGSIEECKLLSEKMAERFCSINQVETIREYSGLVQKIILAVDMDLSQALTLQYFSDALSVNPSYLSNLFKKETGVTITDYVTDHRMRAAANLLRKTQLPVKTVSKQVGIMDVHYFCRLFKKRTGRTPSQYRADI